MQPTYAHIERLSVGASRPDRATQMPLLGLLSGLSVALGLWSGIAALVWAVVS